MIPRKLLIIAGLGTLPFFFKVPIESLFDVALVNPVVSHFRSSNLMDLIIIDFSVGLSLWIVVQRIQGKLLDWETTVWFSIIVIYILMNRLAIGGFDHYDFIKFGSSQTPAYVDFLVAPLIIAVVGRIVPNFSNDKVADPLLSLLDDANIESQKQDVLGRYTLANVIADHIHHSRSNRAIAIGINAKWGNGKTSFQKLVTEAITSKDSRVIVVEFNPWRSVDKSQIISDFFTGYADAIGQFSIRLSSTIEAYAKQLFISRENFITDIINRRPEPQEKSFSEINTQLEKLHRKVIVIIDDLDRLNKEETIEVLKLIRNSANFSNTYFIVGFDADYLAECLGEYSEYGRRTFIRKIFQIQYELSRIPTTILLNNLQESIKTKLPEFANELSSSLESQSTVTDAFNSSLFGNALHEDIIPGLLENLRDVKRFANFLSISIRPIRSEIVFEDYFYISLIRYKYPELVKYIRKFKKTFFDTALENRRPPKADELKKALRVLKIDRLEKELITKVFDYLYSGRNSKQQKSISNFLKFDIYFDNDISTQSILYGDFFVGLDKPWNELRGTVSSWMDNSKSLALSEIIRHLDVFETRVRFENVVKIWIYLIDFGPRKDFMASYFIDFINRNRQTILSLYDSHTQLEAFFENRFQITSDCFFSTTFVLRDVLRKYIDKTEGFYFPLDEGKARSICNTRLLQFAGTRQKFDQRVFNLFYYNCWAGFSSGRRVVLTQEANACVFEHVSKFPHDYLRWTVRPKATPMIDGFYVFEPFTNQYFGDWDKFEMFLKSNAAENNEFEPLLKFFDEFKISGFQHFYSEEIPRWLEVVNGNSTNKYFEDQTPDALARELYSV